MNRVEMIVPLTFLALYGTGAGVFSKRVLPGWRFYAELGDRDGWHESVQFLVGTLCAVVWPLAWVLLRREG